MAVPICQAEPGNWRIVPNIGYATVDFRGVNANAARYRDAMSSFFKGYMAFPDYTGLPIYIGSVKYTVDEVSSGLVGSVDLGYQLFSGGGVGFRLGYLKPGDLKVKGVGSAYAPFRIWGFDTIDHKWKWITVGWWPGEVTLADEGTISSYAASLLAGGWIEGGEKQGLNYSAFIYAGPSYARRKAVQKTDFTDSYYSYTYSMAYTSEASGMQAGFELGGKLGYGVGDYASFFAEFGFRYQEIAYMREARDIDVDGDGIIDIHKKDRAVDFNGTPVVYNFSGVSLKAGIQLQF